MNFNYTSHPENLPLEKFDQGLGLVLYMHKIYIYKIYKMYIDIDIYYTFI